MGDVGGLRERVRTRIVPAVQQRAERRGGPRTHTWVWVQKISRARPVTTLLNTIWPAVQPEEILAALLTRPDTLAAAAEGILDADEQKTLLWPKPPRSARSAHWSAADLVLLDELAQGTTPWAARDWPQFLAHLEKPGAIVTPSPQDSASPAPSPNSPTAS